MVAIIQPRKCSSRFVGKRANHAFESLALKVGDVVVQLVSQRFQGPTAGPADHDFPQQVTGQLRRHYLTRHPQQLRRRLPGAGKAGIIQHRQLSDDPRLEHLQHRRFPRQQCAWHRLTEDLADYHRQLPRPLSIIWTLLLGGVLYRRRGGRP